MLDSARTLAWLVLLAASGFGGCNAITGAGDPEVVAGEGGSSGTLATSAAATSDASAATGVGGAGDDDGPGTPFPCGDGAIGSGEQCDDGNLAAGDGCDELCRIECGPGEAARLPTQTCLSVSGVGDERSWEDARAACQDLGGDLAVLDDLDTSALDGRLDGPAHIGGLRASEDDLFEWIDGATVEAHVVDGTSEGADCLDGVVALEENLDGLLELHAVICSDRARFICERDPMASSN